MQFATARPRVAARPPARASVVAAAKFRPQSRIGKVPVAVPSGVEATVSPSENGSHLTIKVLLCLPHAPAQMATLNGSRLRCHVKLYIAAVGDVVACTL